VQLIINRQRLIQHKLSRETAGSGCAPSQSTRTACRGNPA